MLVIVASRYDSVARALVSRWADHDAVLLTCADLSVAGWRYYLDATEASTAVIGKRVVVREDITGVLTLLPYVSEAELAHIVPAEQSYVAAEMTAFLLSWLSGLRCAVLNRPTPICLAGPYWRPAQWVFAAAQLGIPVRAINTCTVFAVDTPPEPVASPVTVTVVGDRCFGAVDEVLMAQSRRLAAVAGVELLAVHFSGSTAGAHFLGIDLVPDVSSPEIADAVLECLLRGRVC